MAHGNAAIGHGAVIMFAGKTTDPTNSFCANIVDFDWSSIARASVDRTHMGIGDVKSFLTGGTYDAGALSVTLQFNTGSGVTNATNAIAELMTAAAQSCTMQFGTATYKADAFMTDMGIASGDEDIITQPVTLKFTGAVATAATIV